MFSLPNKKTRSKSQSRNSTNGPSRRDNTKSPARDSAQPILSGLIPVKPPVRKWIGEQAAKRWLEKTKFEEVTSEFRKLQTIATKMEDSKIQDFKNFMLPIKVEWMKNVFVSKIPKSGAEELFWREVYQNQVLIMKVIMKADTDQPEFFPRRAGDYVYYRSMFVNNRKMEHFEGVDRCWIEILPDGYSNSVICRVTVMKGWTSRGAQRKESAVLEECKEMIDPLNTIREQNYLVVSNDEGAGNFISLAAEIANMEQGNEPNIVATTKVNAESDVCKTVGKMALDFNAKMLKEVSRLGSSNK